MKVIIGWIIFIGSIVGGLYIGGWLMFVQPIIEACKAFDAGTLTGLIVGTTILKCIFASTVGGLIAYIGAQIAGAFFKM
jgi:hypothetical protein